MYAYILFVVHMNLKNDQTKFKGKINSLTKNKIPEMIKSYR